MNNQNVEFYYDGVTMVIHCSEKETMKDIVQKFCVKAKIDKSTIYCLYAGKILDEEILSENILKSKSKDDKIVILVYPLSKQTIIKEQTVKPSNIICPKCQDIAMIKIKDYKIEINCKNYHYNNIFLKDFYSCQKIDESKIICNSCKKQNKANTYNNEFFICLQCNINLCPLCKSSHNSNHSIIKYDQKNYMCLEHEDTFSSYCNQCKKNLCTACENKHYGHEIISLGKLFPDKNELKRQNETFKVNLDKLKENVKNLVDILNNFIKNIEIFYNIKKEINDSFSNKLKNYEYLNCIKEINNNEILNDMTKILNENNKCYKFQQIFNIYNNMILKEQRNMMMINNNNMINNNMINNNMMNNNMINNNMMNNNNIQNNNMMMNNYIQNNNNMMMNNGVQNNNNMMMNNNIQNNNMMNNNIQNNFNSNNMNFNNNFNQNMSNYNKLNPRTIISKHNFIKNLPSNNFGINNNINSNMFNNNMNQNISNNNFNNNMNNFPMNNFNNNGFDLNFQNSNEEEEWIKVFKMVVEEYKFIFKTSNGIKTEIKAPFVTTISQLLEKYLKIVNREYLIGNNSKISFIHNTIKLKFEDHTLVEDYFKNYNSDSYITIAIVDVNCIIGGKEKYITFKGNKGTINSFNFAENLSINDLITYFLKSIKKENLKGNKKISYLYNGNQIKSKDMEKYLETYFKNNDKPVIIVNDSSNLL